MATQTETLGFTSTAAPGGDIIAGDFPRHEKTIVIVEDQAALVRGTVLGKITASGKYKVYSNAANDGSEVARGILTSDTPAAPDGDVPATMYVTGEFFESELTGIDAAGIADLEAINCYVV